MTGKEDKDDDHDYDAITRQIAEIEARALEKLRSVEGVDAPLDDETMTMITEVNAIVAAERELRDHLGRDPTEPEIAERAQLPLERVREIRRVS